jgi:copper chaperone CopZ
MELSYSFTYLPCQTCTAKIHCEQCQETIAAALRKLPGMQSAQVNIPEKTLRITGSNIDEDAVEDALDAIGVFL